MFRYVNLLLSIVVAILISSPMASAQSDEDACQKQEKQIRALLAECSTCKQDTDCNLDKEIYLGCPFGCYFLKGSGCSKDLYDSLQFELNVYSQQCATCMYECVQDPKQEEIHCVENQCVDVRELR